MNVSASIVFFLSEQYDLISSSVGVLKELPTMSLSLFFSFLSFLSFLFVVVRLSFACRLIVTWRVVCFVG